MKTCKFCRHEFAEGVGDYCPHCGMDNLSCFDMQTKTRLRQHIMALETLVADHNRRRERWWMATNSARIQAETTMGDLLKQLDIHHFFEPETETTPLQPNETDIE